jgi:ribosomal protein L37E
MALALCRRCRREITAEESFCPHCGIRDPADLSREENWATARDPRNLPSGQGLLRFLVVAVVVLVLIAVGIGVMAFLSTPGR